MSGVFSLKQHKSSRNLKKLSILAPINASPQNSPSTSLLAQFPTPTTPVVVLKAKYNFVARAAPEISVRANDYFKLVDRPGNGWVMVQCIDRNSTGIIPALYVEIAVNDLKQPVLEEWLLKVAAPQSAIISDMKQLRVSNVLLDRDNKCWYRLDIKLKNGNNRYVAKYYQDFYQLHVCLLEEFYKLVKLPSLPRTIRTPPSGPAAWTSPQDTTYMKELVAHCEELDKYLNRLLRLDDVLQLATLFDFIFAQSNNSIEFDKDEQLIDDHINDALNELSLNVTGIMNPLRKLSFSPTAPLPPVSTTKIPHSPSTLKLFNYSNTKYSLYLNQTLPMTPDVPQFRTFSLPERAVRYQEKSADRSPEKPDKRVYSLPETKKSNLLTREHYTPKDRRDTVVESKSSQTISSFTSLFASYDLSSTDEDTKRQSLSPRRAGPGEFNPVVKTRTKNNFSFSTNGSDRTLSSGSTCPSSHQSSSSTDSILLNGNFSKGSGNEPQTPTMNMSGFESQIPRVTNEPMIQEEPDYFQPLQPKMHKEMMTWNSDKREDDYDLDILPRHPARLPYPIEEKAYEF